MTRSSPNRLASVTDTAGTRTASYDTRGNTVAETRADGTLVAASYDGHARLAGYERSNIGAQAYTYNGLGDRVRVDKPTGTRRFVYDSQGRVMAEYGGSAGEVWAEFIWALPPGANDNTPFGGGDGVAGYAPLALVAQNVSGLPELYWVHGNHLGVPQVTTNAAGQVVDPGDDFLRPGFPGQSQVLSDLYYNRARDYDPVLGRYIQADPIGLMGDVNPYVYAGADPVNMIDPLGLQASTARPSAGQLFDVALEWWAKRQIKKGATRGIPVVGQALSAGDALGAALAVMRFEHDCYALEMAANNRQRRKRIEGLQKKIDEHLAKLDRDPNGRDSQHWRDEIKAWNAEIQRIRGRLPNGR